MDELSVTTCELPQRPRDIYTDSSFEFAKYRLARACVHSLISAQTRSTDRTHRRRSREVVHKLVSDSTTFTYDTILALDHKYRDVLHECSVASMKRDISTRANPSRTWKEAIAEEGLHSRLVRLHRPFMAKHAYSRTSCLESAEKLVRSHAIITATTRNVSPVHLSLPVRVRS